jgi:tRNA A37 N6-isopentenylltransferase MiaA
MNLIINDKYDRINIKEIEEVSKIIEKEASKIRVEKSVKYSDGFQTFYDKFSLIGCQTDLYRKFARMDAFSATNNPIVDKEALENNYLDMINYCKLQLTWLRHTYWGNFSWEIDPEPHTHVITGAVITGANTKEDLPTNLRSFLP